MAQMLPHSLRHRLHVLWRYRDAAAAPAPPGHDSFRKTRELFSTSWSVLQRDDLSAGAKMLYSALDSPDQYVVCLDRSTITTRVGLNEQAIDTCLNELTRAGVISSRMGNLVFFG